MKKSMDKLRSRVAIVTGAARGIGRATSLALAKDGVDIVGIDICAPICQRSGVKASTPEDLQETGKLVEATGRRWRGEIQDQRNISALRDIAKDVENGWGGMDIVFANAGIQEFRPLLDLEDIEWQTHIDVNLTGTANVIRVFAPYLIKNAWGRIIVTASTQGRHGTKYGAAYSASKWGIIGLMKSAALELGPYGITVNAIIPGLINTPLTRHEERFAQILEDAGKQPQGLLDDENNAKQILTTKTPLGVPWIEPEDVASVVAFLASDAAKMVSGATYDITAGDSAHYM